MNPPTTPKEEAIVILNTYAAKKAALKEVLSPLQRQIAELTAQVEIAQAPHQTELEAMEKQLKKLALEHGPAIFGEARSLVQNGFILQVRGSESVQVDDEEAAIRELTHLASIAATPEARMAYEACLRVSTVLDKDYVTKLYARDGRSATLPPVRSMT